MRIWERLTRKDIPGRELMSESNPTVSPGVDAEPGSQPGEWSERRFFFLYAAVFIHTVGTICALWLFSSMFD